MNKNRKLASRISTVLLVLVFMVFGIVLQTSAAEAKGIPTLSAKSVTVAFGGKQTIKLRNGKGKWSIEGDGIIRITKQTKTQITVTPVKKGTASITCKTGGKTLQCKVKVLNNKTGNTGDDLGYAVVVGKPLSVEYTIPKGVSLEGAEYDKTMAKVTVSKDPDEKTGKTSIKLTIRPLKPGRFILTLNYLNGTETQTSEVAYVFINGFRGKAKAARTSANYRKWRKKTISTMVSADMSTWEIIDAIGKLISTGKYSSSGGATGIQLWYGGNGTCISGAKMMKDFMDDLGVNCTVHFAGKDSPAADIYGYTIYYASQHKNVRVRLGGKRYELNPQPGVPWPIGTVRR